MRLLLALLLTAASVAPARAGSDEEERARAHYEIGLGLYRLADYRGAVREFSAGYQLAHKPGFLLNLGQSYRKLGELRAARDEYRQFLVDAPSDDPARPEARKVLAELEKAVAASATPAPAVAPETPASTPAATAPTPALAPTLPAAPSLRVTAPARPRRRALRIGGLLCSVAGAGLLAGGVGTAVAANRAARDLTSLDRSGGVYDSAKDRAYTLDRNLSIALFAGGAALAATGTILLIVSAR